jgi:FkbM family methyltransferase
MASPHQIENPINPDASIANREKAEILTEIAARKPLASPLTAKMLDWAIDADPECSNAQFVRGRAALAAKDWVTAALRFAGAANLDKTNAAACVNAAFADDRLDLQPNAVEPWCREAISRDPSYAQAYIQLFGIYERAARHEDAAAILEQGLAACTDQHGLLFCRASLRLGAGDFERGWLDYEHRPSRLKLATLMDEYEEWDGGPLTQGHVWGKHQRNRFALQGRAICEKCGTGIDSAICPANGKTLFIAREQGFGDEIMFARYLPLLAELGEKVVLHTYPELARLFASVPGVSQVLTCDQDAVEFDVWTTLGSLPLKMAIATDSMFDLVLPGGGLMWGTGDTYLSPSIGTCSYDFGPSTNLRVGLCWQGNPEHGQDRFRSLPFEALRPLLKTPGCDFFSLQINDTESGLVNLRAYTHDWADMAAAMEQLDVVISVDTGVAHLAGAIGKECWLLLGQPTDWRWGREGSTSPWYPKHLLFRGAVPMDWEGIVEDAGSMLASKVANRRAYRPTGETWDRPAHPPSIQGIKTAPCRYGDLFWYSSDHYIGRSLDYYGEWSEGEVDAFRAILRPGDVMVEAGANVGSLTLAAASIVGSKGDVLAFEPQPKYLDLLSKACEGSRVAIFRAALGSKGCTIQMTDVETKKLHAPGWKTDTPIVNVEQTTIDALDLGRCHFIKIDVDGQELDILQGADATVDRCRPVIYVEYDKPNLYEDMIPWLMERGYRIYSHNSRLWNPNNWRKNPLNVFGNLVSAMLLCIPNERKDLRRDNLGLDLQRVRAK